MLSKQITVTIEPSDIKGSRRMDCSACAVSNALNRVFNRHDMWYGFGDNVGRRIVEPALYNFDEPLFWKNAEGSRISVRLDKASFLIAYDFDSGSNVVGRTFKILDILDPELHLETNN